MSPSALSTLSDRSAVRRSLVYALPLAVAVAVFWIAFDAATYGLVGRTTLAIVVWWSIALALGLSVWPLARVPRAALVTGGLLALFALYTALSVAWSPSAENAFNEFNRVALYLGVYCVAVLASSRANADRWCDGIAVGIVGIGVLALVGRCFPQLVSDRGLAEFLPTEAARLSYPLDYWNGLAIFLALGVPLLLRAAVAAGSPLRRGLAVAPLPAFAAVVYLTSSRSGTAAVAIAAVAYLALGPRRWTTAGALLAGGAGAAVAVGFVAGQDELVNGPFDTAAAHAQGRNAALVVALACAGAGLVYGLLCRRGVREPSRRTGQAVVALVLLLAVVGLVLSHPVAHFQDFKRTPEANTGVDAIQEHLLSASGNGRWQWWSSAIDEFKEHPLHGGGAGSYEAWWTQHGNLPTFVRDAHSLYAETLGELGLLGFVLLLAVIGSALVASVCRLRKGDDRATTAALLAGLVAYLVVAGTDWMWELTAVSVVGMLYLGLLTGPATATSAPVAAATDDRPPRPNVRAACAVALVAAAPFVIGSQLVPLLAELEIRASQDAVSAGDGDRALADALAARRLQGWASSTHLQLALVQEQLGELQAAERTIKTAIAHDEENWRLWLVRARIETKLGEIPEARASLRRAVELNPRSPLFSNLGLD